MMNREVKKKWVEALRSGHYHQGREHLRQNYDDDYEYCCLGVLCEVEGLMDFDNHKLIRGDIERHIKIVNGDEYHDQAEILIEDEELPGVILDFFGISADQQKTLIKMNDDQGDNFLSIAKYIEENL